MKKNNVQIIQSPADFTVELPNGFYVAQIISQAGATMVVFATKKRRSTI